MLFFVYMQINLFLIFFSQKLNVFVLQKVPTVDPSSNRQTQHNGQNNASFTQSKYVNYIKFLELLNFNLKRKKYLKKINKNV